MRYVKYTIRELFEIEESAFVESLFEHTEKRKIREATADDAKKIASWKDCLSFLKEQFEKNNVSVVSNIAIAFEYQLFDNTWVDAVIVCKDKLIILEFKSGSDCSPKTLYSHRAQVVGYMNKITHCNRVIWEERKRNPDFAVEKYLVYTNATMRGKVVSLDYIKVTDDFSDVIDSISEPADEARVAKLLDFTEELDITTTGIMRDILNRRLLSEMYVQDDNVKACAEIVDNIYQSQTKQSLNLIFIKGNPGTGKTGTGFSLLEKYMGHGAKYVTGNGNLSKIFSMMIKEDKIQGVEAAAVGSLHNIYNVSNFCRKYYKKEEKKADICNNNILIIDEAQRVWNPIQIALAKKNQLNPNEQAFVINKEVSEPLLVLRAILNSMKKDGTSRTVIFLLGSGQEIYIGEEDGERYIKKAVEHVKDIITRIEKDISVNVYVPIDEMKTEYSNCSTMCIKNSGLLLKDNKRNEFNHHALTFVNDFIDEGYACAESMTDAFFLFNDYAQLKEAVKIVNDGAFSIGILACGFDTEKKEKYGKKVYYLVLGGEEIYNIDNSELMEFYTGKKSNDLKKFASQFNCQGLELDYSIVVWGKSLLWRNGHWELSKSSIWAVDHYHQQLEELKAKHSELSGITIDKEQVRKTFIKNSYRVLLTRARIATYVYIDDKETYEHFRDMLQD